MLLKVARSQLSSITICSTKRDYLLFIPLFNPILNFYIFPVWAGSNPHYTVVISVMSQFWYLSFVLLLSKSKYFIAEVGEEWDCFISLFVLVSVTLVTACLTPHGEKVA